MKGMSMDNRSTLTAFIHCHTCGLNFEKTIYDRFYSLSHLWPQFWKNRIYGFFKIERTGVTMNKSGERNFVVHGHTFHMPKSGIITLKIYWVLFFWIFNSCRHVPASLCIISYLNLGPNTKLLKNPSCRRNIAEQSSEDRPPLVKITENIFQSQTNYILAHSGKAHHRELILIQTHYILARLTKRISPKTCFKATQIIFWRTHKRHITENKF